MAVHVKASTILIDKFMSIFAGRGSKYWIRVAKLARIRDKYKCTVCNSTQRLEVHHLLDWSNNRFVRFDLGNLVTLCRQCHHSYHVDFMGGFSVKTDGVSFLKWRRKRKRELKK